MSTALNIAILLNSIVAVMLGVCMILKNAKSIRKLLIITDIHRERLKQLEYKMRDIQSKEGE